MNESLSYDFVAPPKIVFGWGRRREVGLLGRTLGRRAMILSGLPPAVAADVLGEIRELLSAQEIDPTLVETILHEPEVQDVDRVARELRGTRSTGLFPAGRRRRGGHRPGQGRGRRGHESAKPDGGRLSGERRPRAEDRRSAAACAGHAHHGRDGRRGHAERGHFLLRSAFQEKSSRRPHPAADRPDRSGAYGPRAAGSDRGQRHGRDHATHRKLHSRKAQPIPQALAVQGLRMAVPAIAEAVENGRSRRRGNGCRTRRLLSGMALANSGLGLAHGVAPALGIHCRVPHGMACAVMLPSALRINRDVRQAELATLARLLFGSRPRRPTARRSIV